MKYWIRIAVSALLLVVPSVVCCQISCTNNAYAYSVRDTCACNGAVDYPGGCRNQLNSGSSCTIESLYSCGKNGDTNCEIAFAETTGPTCGNDGAAIPSNRLPAGSSNFTRWLSAQLHDEPADSRSACMANAERFNQWLAQEIVRQRLRKESL